MLLKYQTDSERIRPVLVAIGPYKNTVFKTELVSDESIKKLRW